MEGEMKKQKCTVCDGTGTVESELGNIICDVCWGYGKTTVYPCEMTVKGLIMETDNHGVTATRNGKTIAAVKSNYEDLSWWIYYEDGSAEAVRYTDIVTVDKAEYVTLTMFAPAINKMLNARNNVLKA
jgi:RecJ-like exonuclease